MLHPHTLEVSRCALVVSDMQEAFQPVMADFDPTADRIAKTVRAAQLLGIPILITEQYPKGLGHTVEQVRAALPAGQQIIEKTAFSSCGAAAFVEQLERLGSRQILLCGLEAHICVNQTAHDLLAGGHQVHLLDDCILSREPHNREIGLAKMRLSGAIPSSMEMALFELMHDASHAQFKAIQKLVK